MSRESNRGRIYTRILDGYAYSASARMTEQARKMIEEHPREEKRRLKGKEEGESMRRLREGSGKCKGTREMGRREGKRYSRGWRREGGKEGEEYFAGARGKRFSETCGISRGTLLFGIRQRGIDSASETRRIRRQAISSNNTAAEAAEAVATTEASRPPPKIRSHSTAMSAGARGWLRPIGA